LNPKPPEPARLAADHVAVAVLHIAEELALELRPQLEGRLHITAQSRIERDLGIDSLGRLELSARLEQALDARLSTRVINEAETLADLATAVLASSGAAGIERLVALPVLASLNAEPVDAVTLPEVLAWHITRHPERRHVLLLTDEGAERPVTYGELATNAGLLATALATAGLIPGERVALMAPTSPDFLWGFFGCLLAGCVPVPVYPPARPAQLEEHLLRQRDILRDAGVAFLLLTPELRAAGRLVRPLVESLRGVGEIPQMVAGGQGPALGSRSAANELALLQYTSGSTGDPKGVMLTHANLLATSVRWAWRWGPRHATCSSAGCHSTTTWG
jgi:non-ribosomal peptide synthetase component F